MQNLANAEAVANHLTEEMNIARVQEASLEVQKTVSDMKAEFERRELYLQKKMESDAQAHAHTIAIQKNRVSAQTQEISEQKSIIAENSGKHRRMFNDLHSLQHEMHENQISEKSSLKATWNCEDSGQNSMQCRKAVPQNHQKVVRVQCQMPTFPWETPQKEHGEPYGKPRPTAAGEVPPPRWGGCKETCERCMDRVVIEFENAGPNRDQEAGYNPGCGEGRTSNSGNNEPGQPPPANRNQFDPNASNEDLLRAALLQVLGGAPKVKEADSVKFAECHALKTIGSGRQL